MGQKKIHVTKQGLAEMESELKHTDHGTEIGNC